MAQVTENVLTDDVKVRIDAFISEVSGQEGALMHILHCCQELLGYIPYEVQKYIAEKTGISLAEIYGVVTFYSRFTLNPTGKYKVGVCLGTACYVKGADKIVAEVEKILNLKAGETSEDFEFSVEATRCIGACGLAPVMTVNEDVYGKLTVEEVKGILDKYIVK